MLTALPIRYVADIDESRRFYSGLGLPADPGSEFGNVWTMLRAEAGAIGIHAAHASKGKPPGTAELGFMTDERLEDVQMRLAALGYNGLIHDEDFGRSLRLTDPDGVVVQIQEIDPETSLRSAAALSHA